MVFANSKVNMATLGGSIFVRNAIKYDYCILEAIQSLMPVCDQVSILECGSDDGTKKLLQDFVKRHSGRRCRIILNCDAHFDCADDYSRLAILANLAKSYLSTDWHFMLQADEILHENSYKSIYDIINFSELHESYHCRRINFYRSPAWRVRYDIPTSDKPCNDHPIRLARIHLDAIGDAESIENVHDTDALVNLLSIHHYGFIRKDVEQINKASDMLKWFFGEAREDERIEAMKNDGKWNWQNITDESKLTAFTGTHPKAIRAWLSERWQSW